MVGRKGVGGSNQEKKDFINGLWIWVQNVTLPFPSSVVNAMGNFLIFPSELHFPQLQNEENETFTGWSWALSEIMHRSGWLWHAAGAGYSPARPVFLPCTPSPLNHTHCKALPFCWQYSIMGSPRSASFPVLGEDGSGCPCAVGWPGAPVQAPGFCLCPLLAAQYW